MAENIELDAGSGGSTVAADEIAGVHFPRSKIVIGADGVNDGDVSSANPLPVVDAAGNALLTTIDTDTGAMVTDLAAIEVLLTAANVDHAANEVLLTTIAGDTTSLDGKVTACNTGAVVLSSGTVTTVSTVTNLAQLGGQAVSMGTGVRDAGTQRVTVATDDSVPVTGTFYQATQPVSGTVTANLSATDNAVLDAIAASVAGTLTVGSHAVTNAGTFAVQVNSCSLPTGAATEATLSTLNGKVTACNTGAVTVSAALPAGTNTIGGTISQLSSNTLYEGTTAKTVQHFHVVTSTSDTSIITAAGAGVKFRILSLSIIGLSATATNVHFETKTTNTDCFGDSTNPIPIAVDADGDNVAGVILPWNPGGWFETADANEDLAVILSAAQPVLICGNYIEVS